MRWMLIVVATLTFATSGLCEQDMWTDRAEADLDGDGAAEQISLERLDRVVGAFTLHVGEADITDRLSDDVSGLRVVDIWGHDDYREVAVHTNGPSDDPDTWLFWYNGSELHRVGRIAGYLSIGPFAWVYARQWMGFWDRSCAWLLDNETHRLDEQAQDFYAVDLTATVRTAHPIYRTPDLATVAGQMQPGTSVTVVACRWADEYEDLRYLVVLPGGETGWLGDITGALNVAVAD